MTTFFVGFIKILLSTTIWLSGQITTFEINGGLTWQTTRPESSSTCVPAAFTKDDGSLVHKSTYYGVTFTKDSFTVSKNKGDFFQLLLVNNGKIINSKDDRHFVRRALCKDKDGKMFIIQSRYPMTLPHFARILQNHCTYAVNLDMGNYGYGRVNGTPVFVCTYFTRDKQTNWICSEK